MVNVFNAIDGVCLHRAKQFSHYLQVKTGYDNLFFARLFNLVCFLLSTPIAVLAYQLAEVPDKARWVFPVLSSLIMLLALDNFLFIWAIGKVKNGVAEESISYRFCVHSCRQAKFFRLLDYYHLIRLLIITPFLPTWVIIAIIIQDLFYLLGKLLIANEINELEISAFQL